MARGNILLVTLPASDKREEKGTRPAIAVRETIEPEEQELIMQLSPLYLEKLQVAQQIGEVRHAQAQTLRLLSRRVGDVSAEILAFRSALIGLVCPIWEMSLLIHIHKN